MLFKNIIFFLIKLFPPELAHLIALNIIKFYPFSRIFSIQLNTSLTKSLSGILKEQIKNEKKYLYAKKLYPGNIINFFQFSILGIILLKTKLKHFLSS